MNMHNQSRDFSRKNAGARSDDAREFNEVMDALRARDAEIKSFADKATAEIKATGQMATETKSALEKLSADGASISDRLQAVEQKMSRRSFGPAAEKSIGERFTDSDDFKALAEKGRGTARLNLKATITSAPASAGELILPDRRPEIIRPQERELTIRDLLLPGRTSSNAVEHIVETGFVNAAAPVAEGALKPESSLSFEMVTTPVRTIAHWIPASKQVLADIPMLMSYIDTRLRFGLKYREEEQLIRGDGTGQNIKGLSKFAIPFGEATLSKAGDTALDTIRRAILQVRLAEYRPTFIVLNPVDWADLELSKDAEGRYLFVNVQVGATMQIWRLTVIETTAMGQGEFLVGATMGAQIFDREDAAVEVSTEHADFFTRNLVAIRAEERLALAVTRPESFVWGQFDLGASPTING